MASAAVNADRQALSATAAELAARLLAAEFLTPQDISDLLNVSRWQLAKWRIERQGPPFHLRARGVVVYPSESFKSYLRARGAEKSAGRSRRARVEKLLATVEK